MIEVRVRLHGEEPQREMLVRAQSIAEALRVAKRHGFDGEVRVVYAIDADRFFVRGVGGASNTTSNTTGLDGREEATV